jgi:hypothetical protein
MEKNYFKEMIIKIAYIKALTDVTKLIFARYFVPLNATQNF